MSGDVERVIAAMAKAWDVLPEMGTVAEMRQALAQAAMREVRLIDAEALRALEKGHVDPWMGVADWLKGRADERRTGE